MEIYEQICKVIELYNQYKGNLNDDGTVATDEQIAEWIVPSIEDYKEEIDEEELDNLANKMYPDDDDDYTQLYGIDNYEYREAFKVGYRKALEEYLNNNKKIWKSF